MSGLKLGIIEKALSCSESLAIGFSKEEETEIYDAIKELLTKCVIRKHSHENGEFAFPAIYVTRA